MAKAWVKVSNRRVAISVGFLLGLLFQSVLASRASQAFAQSLAPEANRKLMGQSPAWLALLHYQRNFLGSGYHSRADGPDFFLTPRGAEDPEGELDAHILAFNGEAPHAATSLQCRFPARYAWLKAQGLVRANEGHCADLAAFLKELDGSALSLVFSSAYPGSPPSMFGHTLLRVHGKDRPALSDYAINYAASVTSDENAIAFSVMGLMGGYWGEFGIVRYFMKVNEYAHSESRDLWEYQLGLTPDEVRFVLLSVYELSRAPTFKYFFFDENCSDQILKLIFLAREAVGNTASGRAAWPRPWFGLHVVPAETVKAFVEIPGAVSDIRYRPSLRSRLQTQLQKIGAESPQAVIAALEAQGASAQALNVDQRRAHLDAAILYYEYETFKALGGSRKLAPEDQARYQIFLGQRAKLGASPVTPKNDQAAPLQAMPSRPDQGHGPHAIAVSAGVAEARAFTELKFKFAYHDQLNSDVGFPAWSQVDFPHAVLRWTPGVQARRDVTLERLAFATITSLAPWTQWEKRLSWRVDLGLSAPKDVQCRTCAVFGAEVGAGLTTQLWGDRFLASALVLPRFEAGSGLGTGSRFVPKVTAFFLVNPAVFQSRYKLRLSGSWVRDLFQTIRRQSFYEAAVDQSVALAQNWDIRLHSTMVLPVRQSDGAYRELQLSLQHYF